MLARDMGVQIKRARARRHGKHWELLQHALKTYDGPHK